jgi:hypothetical protein
MNRYIDMSRYIFVLIVALILCLIGAWITMAKAQDAALGDSIAEGTGRALGVPTYARVNSSSCWVLRHTPSGPFDHVVISAGINDAPGACVKTLLDRLRARVVVVILPAPINTARANVEREAARHGFATVSYACPGGCSRRSFHPSSYAVVAAAVRSIWHAH